MAGIAKSATTPAYMTTLLVRSHRPDQASLWGSSKDLRSPQLITWQRPNLFSRKAAGAARPNHPCHAPEPMGQRRDRAGFPSPTGKPLSRTAMHSVSTGNPRLTHNPRKRPRVPRMLHPTQDMTRIAKPHSAHDQTTDQAGTNQVISHGYL